MATETPLSIQLRREIKHSKVLKEIFLDKNDLLPQIFQFDPRLRYIESVNEALLFTANSGMPLVRYSLGDRGTVVSVDELKKRTTQKKLQAKVTPAMIHDSTQWKLPFVVLRGRLDHAVLFYGINMYPEFFHHALNSKKFLRDITGKFVIETRHNKKMEPYLQLHIELQPGRKGSHMLTRDLEDHIEKTLRSVSIEYRFLLQNIKKVARPKVALWKFQSPEYFPAGVKPKYIRK